MFLRHVQPDQSGENCEATKRKKTRELRGEARQLREQAREQLKVQGSHSNMGGLVLEAIGCSTNIVVINCLSESLIVFLSCVYSVAKTKQ